MLKKDYPELAEQWDYERNAKEGLSFEDAMPGSSKKAWWRCEKGHSYYSVIHSRACGTGCPYCAGKRAIKGRNDFATLHPEMLSEWDYEKNDKLGIKPDEISIGSQKKVNWICKEGHEYERSIYDRLNGRGHCPYCSNRKILTSFNDLATTHPELVKEWDFEKNDKLGIYPEKIGAGLRKKVWWKCPNGHSYYSVVFPRTHGIGCPYCSNKKILVGFNDVATTNPELIKDWDYAKNIVKPTEVGRGYTKKIWWKCDKGHSYDSLIVNHDKCGCPYCSGHRANKTSNLFTRFPGLAQEWDYERNAIDPSTIVRGGKQKFWWKCDKGHRWEATVNTRVASGHVSSCPMCTQRLRVSLPEKAFFFYLKKVFPDAEENYRPTWLNGKELDIYLPSKKVGIEYDGCRYHQTKRDSEKGSICKVNNVTLIHIRENGTPALKTTDALVFNLPEKYKPDCSHIVPGLEYLEKVLGVDLPADLNRDYDEIRKLVVDFDKDNCIAKTNPECLAEWDYEKNNEYGITPENTTAGAGFNVYWRCARGHSYKAVPSNKINGGTGCPYCSGRKVLTGFNDIATVEPELLKKWDYKKNVIKPTEVTSAANKRVWLICDKGHSYSALLLNHKRSGCPYCSGHKVLVGFNDLATTHPELLKEWDYDTNTIQPTEISKGYDKKVAWVCSKGHRYYTSPNQKTYRGASCPYCSGQRVLTGFNDIATTNPELLSEWDYEKNQIEPTEISKGSGKKVWLKCDKGHSYETTLPSRLSGHKCNYCSSNKVLKGYNDLATTNPKLAQEWDYEKNGDLKPQDVMSRSGKKVWWKCSKGHEWEAYIAPRSKGVGCPICSGHKVLKGFNDLATVRKDLLPLWNFEKNKTITPTDITAGSGKKVWWKCSKGHEWEASICNIAKGKRCPYCAGKKKININKKGNSK